MRDEMTRKAAREKEQLKVFYERQHQEAISVLAQEFEQRLAEETESITQQCKDHYRKKMQKMQQSPPQRRMGRSPVTFAGP
jgi:glutathione peroxidase-family protein